MGLRIFRPGFIVEITVIVLYIWGWERVYFNGQRTVNWLFLFKR